MEESSQSSIMEGSDTSSTLPNGLPGMNTLSNGLPGEESMETEIIQGASSVEHSFQPSEPELDISIPESSSLAPGTLLEVSAAGGEITGPHYYVMVTSGSDQTVAAGTSGLDPATIAAAPNGLTTMSTAALRQLTSGAASKPPTVKRGAAKTAPIVVAKSAATATAKSSVVPSAKSLAPRPQAQTLTANMTGSTTGGVLKMIPVAVSPSGPGAVYVPNAQPSKPATKPPVKPVVVTKAPTKPLGVPASSTVIPVKKAVTAAKTSAPVVLPAKPAIKTTVAPAPVKVLKPISAVDKSLQHKRQVAESLLKFRKVERALVHSRPDQATPFTYNEIFQQTAAAFTKIAALTTHVSLESQAPAEYRRWTPELITKFLSSITTFAGSMKEIGDELKQRHESQLSANLKRKAEVEMAAAKKTAALTVGDAQAGSSSSANGFSESNGVRSSDVSTPIVSPAVFNHEPMDTQIQAPEIPNSTNSVGTSLIHLQAGELAGSTERVSNDAGSIMNGGDEPQGEMRMEQNDGPEAIVEASSTSSVDAGTSSLTEGGNSQEAGGLASDTAEIKDETNGTGGTASSSEFVNGSGPATSETDNTSRDTFTASHSDN